MGCHTWFYKKLNISLEQARVDALYICEEQIKWNQQYLNDPTLNRDWLSEDEGDEVFIRSIKHFSRYKQFIEKNLFKSLKTLNRFYSYRLSEDEDNGRFLDGLYDYNERTDSIYICTDDLLHDIFRIGGYPKDQLLSYEETINFMKNYCDKYKVSFEVYFDDLDMIKRNLKEFWQQYPDGMIRFG